MSEGGGILSAFPGALHAVQSWPSVAKAAVSLALTGACGALIVAVWQRPAEPTEPPATQTKTTVKADGNAGAANQTGTRNTQAVQGGEHNDQTTVTGHHNISSPQSQTFQAPVTQAGTVLSTGQSGGQSGIIYNQAPPVTERQKEEALASLKAQLDEFARFPNNASADPQDILEQVVVDKNPIRLYRLLQPFYADTIKATPDYGAQLFTFKNNFYAWRNDSQAIEQNVLAKIGTLVTVRFAAGWAIYLRYYILRAAGATPEQVKGWGDFLNYGITWEDAERIYILLGQDQSISSKSNEIIKGYSQLISVTSDLTEKIIAQD